MSLFAGALMPRAPRAFVFLLTLGFYAAHTVMPQFVLAQEAISQTSNAAAQAASPSALKGRIHILLRSSAIPSVRSLFSSYASADVQQAETTSDEIARDLHLPNLLRARAIRPLVPEHNVVFESLREHLNPSLFKAQTLAVSGNTLLQTSEDRLARWFVLEYDGELNPERAASLALKSDLVEAAEAIYPREKCYRPNDPFVDSLYGLSMIDAFSAWDLVRGDSSMVIADVDDGFWMKHPDLAPSIYHNPGEMGVDAEGHDKSTNGIDDDGDGYIDDWQGWDFAGTFGTFGDNNPHYSAAHGTHTAGIIGAAGDNHVGVVGAAFGAKLMLLKAQPDCDCSIIEGFRGIIYAADHGVGAINCSWGAPQLSLAEQDAIDYAYAKGSIVVAAAGNVGGPMDFYPGSYDRVLSVGACNKSGYDAGSVQNLHVALSAPGDQVLSTWTPPQYYADDGGTSMAAPYVTAALALLRKYRPDLTPQQDVERLRATVTPFTEDLHPNMTGRGILNMRRALTDTAARSLRLVSASIPGRRYLQVRPGETVPVTLVFRNYLAPLTSATIRCVLVDQNGDSVLSGASLIASPIITGPLATLAEYTTSSLQILVDKDLPDNEKYFVKILIDDNTDHYTGDYDAFHLSAIRDYVTLDANNLSVTLDDKGAIGFTDNPRNQNGVGFYVKNGAYAPDARQLLWQGGIVIATDSEHYANVFSDGQAIFPGGWIFSPLDPIVLRDTTEWGSGASVTLHYADTTDTPHRVGIDVRETASELRYREAANTLILEYRFHPLDTLSQFQASLFMDWDIGHNGKDSAHYDPIDSIMYAARTEAGYPVTGIKMLTPLPSGITLNYYAMESIPDSTVGTDIFSNSPAAQWFALTHDRARTVKSYFYVSDVAVTLGAREITFGAGDPRLTYVLAAAATENDVRQAIATAQAIIEGRASLATETPIADGIQIWPNPARNAVHIRAGAHLDVPRIERIVLFDALGRELRRVTAPTADIDISWLPSGSYTVLIQTTNGTVAKAIVKLE